MVFIGFDSRPRRNIDGARRVVRASSALVLAMSACASQASAPAVNPESIRVVGVRSIDPIQPNDSYVAPDGSAWIYQGDGELCVARQAELAAEPICAEWEGSFSVVGVGWSSDGERVAFTQDWAQRFDEADVNVFDIEAGTIDVLTEDSTDDLLQGDAEIDAAPFFGPGDEIYFFRVSDDDETFALYRLDGEDAEPVDGGELGGAWPAGQPIAMDEDTWVVPMMEGGPPMKFASMTFDGSDSVSVNDLWTPDDVSLNLADAAQGRLVMTRPSEVSGNNAAVVVFPDEQTSVELPVDQDFAGGISTDGAKLSADGTHVLEVRSTSDGVARFFIWRIDTDGDDLAAERLDVGDVTDERMGGGFGVLDYTLGWDGGTTLTAIGQAGAVVFDVTTDEP